MKNKKVAIIVGHSPKKPGAKNYLGETEYSFNERIAKKLHLRLSDCDVQSKIFLRKDRMFVDARDELSRHVINYHPYVSIELHFNSFKEEIKGAEVLMHVGNNRILGDRFLTNFERLHLTNRGVKLVYAGDRGYKNLKFISAAVSNTYIIEPCFANFRNDESKNIIEDEHIYVTLLADTLLGFYEDIEKHVEEKKDEQHRETTEQESNQDTKGD